MTSSFTGAYGDGAGYIPPAPVPGGSPFLAPSAIGLPIVMTAPNITSSSGTFSVTDGIIYAVPFFLTGSVSLAKMSIRIGGTQASTGALLRLGVAANLSGNFAPGVTLIDSGTVNGTGAAYSSLVVNLPSSLALNPGVYWALLQQEGAPATPMSMYGVTGSGVVVPSYDIPGNAALVTSRNSNVGYSSAAQSAGPLPATYPLPGATGIPAYSSSAYVPLVGLECH